jgi:hypothetical protein
MQRVVRLIVAVILAVPVLSPAVHACGDKFLMVGRGAKFQRVYASINPGKLLIYARPSTDPKAAIRDPQFHKVLRQAGHSVSVIEDWPLVEQALKTVPVDLVLVDVAEAEHMERVISASARPPAALYVAFSSNAQSSAAQQKFVCRLKASDRPMRFLDEIENALKARARRAKT